MARTIIRRVVMNSKSYAQNIAKVSDRIRASAQKCDRDAAEITLLCVSKTQPAAAIRAAWQAGARDFGENYLQEALLKIEALADLPLCWHFIGPLQSNKTRAVAENFSWVHSVDREKIARRLSEQRPPQLPPLQVCLQVNISSEQSKAGVNVEDLAALAATVATLPGLQLRGLMAIPRGGLTGEQQRQPFADLRRALEALQQQHPQLDTLSMGMSADLEAAIAEGATMVRVGTDIFGPRIG
jgi:pyridoxal phosphate enzyme (YggS family)